MAIELHVLTPTPMLPASIDPEAGFERIWRETRFDEGEQASAWRGHWFLPGGADAEQREGGFVLKAQRAPRGRGVLQRVDRALRTLREIDGLRTLFDDGVPVPEIVAWGIERRRGWPERSFLLQRRIEGSEDFRDFLDREERPEERRRAILAVGRAIVALHARGHFHRNLACRNVLLRERDGTYQVFFIDCPRAACRAPAWRRGYFARADRLFVARHAARTGTTEDEIVALLEASGETDTDHALAVLRAHVARRSLTPREIAWFWLGR